MCCVIMITISIDIQCGSFISCLGERRFLTCAPGYASCQPTPTYHHLLLHLILMLQLLTSLVLGHHIGRLGESIL